MVEMKSFEDFYTVHYLPTLLHPSFNLSNASNAKEEEKFYDILYDAVGEELYISRIDVDREYMAKRLLEAIYENYDEEEIINLILSEFDEDEKEVNAEDPKKLLQEFATHSPEEFIDAIYNYDDELYDNVYDDIIDDILIYNYVYEPAIYEPEVAVEVGLIPFEIYDDDGNSLSLLAIGGIGMDLSPLLDAYQLFVDGSIDPNSTFFSDRKYFKYVVGEEVYKKVLELIGESE
jgi:hypothetical protein